MSFYTASVISGHPAMSAPRLAIQAAGQPHVVQEIIAKRIIEIARGRADG
jgi:hypothetical protein